MKEDEGEREGKGIHTGTQGKRQHLDLITKSGLRPYSRYKAGLYTGEAATYKAINRMVQIQVQSRIQATGKGGRVINKEKDKSEREQGFKGGKGRGSQSEGFW